MKVLVFTLPDGVTAPFSLLERLLKGCSTLDSSGVQSVPFDRVIVASDEVIYRGNFVKNPGMQKQKDLLALWEKMVPQARAPNIEVSTAATVEDVRATVREVAARADERGMGCDVFVTGSIYLVGYVYELFELPLRWIAKV